MSEMSKYLFEDPLAADFLQDPYPSLQIARRDAPVHYLQKYKIWLVTRYADVKAILKDDATFTNANAHLPFFPFAEETARYLQSRNYAPSSPLSGSDGALHRRLREKTAKGLSFTPRRIAEIKASVDQDARDMVERLPKGAEPFDIVSHLTANFPARVIYRLIGFPEEMVDQLLVWSSGRMKIFWSISTMEEQRVMAEGLVDYWEYCNKFIAENLDNPQDNITGNLIRLHREDPTTLSLKEVTTAVFGLIFAGQETTANSTAQTVYMLMQDRRRWERVVKDPTLIDKAFLETLRLTPPVAAWRRFVTKDVEIAGQPIPAGSSLLLHLGSTGHDERKYSDAEKFDLDRPDGNDHLAFSFGTHFCLGASLAKLEARSLIGALIEHEPHLELVPDQKMTVIPNFAFRGPQSLLVRRGFH